MELSGFESRESKTVGGVSKIELVGVGSIEKVVLSPQKELCREVRLKEGAGFVRYSFREDQATYTQKSVSHQPVVLVEHTLWMFLERVDSDSIRAVRELAEASQEGLLALVTLATGERLLVGYSRHLGCEQPLRVVKMESESGESPKERSGVRVVLSSVDCAGAMVVE